MGSQFQLTPGEGEPVRMVRIDVEDTGPGIPEDELPYVFTPFFTRREGGTGLGLAVVQHWVVRHAGQVHISNLREGGAQVRVLLPVPGNA